MKFTFDGHLVDLDGMPLMRPVGDSSIPMTMLFAIRHALISAPQKPLTAEESIKRYDLSLALAQGGEVELDAGDVVLIRNCLAEVYGPLVLGQIAKALREPLPRNAVAADQPKNAGRKSARSGANRQPDQQVKA